MKSGNTYIEAKYKNAYKKGRLVKRVNKVASKTTKFKYKKVSVPKKYASLIKKQQSPPMV